MSSLKEMNDMQQSCQENSDRGLLPDTRTFVDMAAHCVSIKGIEEFNRKIKALNLKDETALNFLWSSDDPFHSFYKEKLAQYTAQNQNAAAQPNGPDIQPDDHTRTINKRLEGRDWIKEANKYDEIYLYSNSSEHPYHVTEYASQIQDDIAHTTVSEAKGDDQLPVILPPSKALPGLLQLCKPPGMTFKEFETMKVTAQFVAWYGVLFFVDLSKRVILDPRFEYMKPTDANFKYFSPLLCAYTEAFSPPEELKQLMGENPAYRAFMLEGFFHRLQWGDYKAYTWKREWYTAMSDWHASISKDFVNHGLSVTMNQLSLMQPSSSSTLCSASPPLPEEPDSNKQKFDE